MSPDFRAVLQEALAPAYELERELSGGGMSRVFVAVEERLRRRVVVKVLPPELAAGVNAERFRREIQLAAQLHHPHIVPLLSAGESGNILYYTMPFIEGESLRSALRKRGRLAVGEVARVLHDVVDALAYAHARGVVHRDIKPDNVLLSGKHAVVTDFGVAKALGSALVHNTASGVTTAGVAIGTPAYMAPEQLAGDPAADHRVDLYAAGLLAYELLTGDSPFAGPSPQATMAAQLTRVPTPLYECCPDVPPNLSDVIMRCLAKNPDERPQSADALLDELVAVTTPQGGALMTGPTRPSGAALGAAGGVTTPRTPVTPPATSAGAAAALAPTA
ncbi:MAG: serine/threonine-protein kinase, partial [Gemmatimonadaceae bacterium]